MFCLIWNLACAIFITYKTLSDGELKCLSAPIATLCVLLLSYESGIDKSTEGSTIPECPSRMCFSNRGNKSWESDRDAYSFSPSSTYFCKKRIMTDVTEVHEGTVCIGGTTTTSLRFADDIDGLAGEEEELSNLFGRLDEASKPTAWRSVPRRPC